MHDLWEADERSPQGLQFTQKVAPSFDGRISWFAFEEAIDDWLDIATLPAGKWAPRLKARLSGDASISKPLLDREKLRDPNEGVDYFKNELRLYCVKELNPRSYSDFTSCRDFKTGTQDLQRWIGRLQVLRQRIIDAWMDTFQSDTAANLEFLVALQAENAQLQADGLAQQQQAALAGGMLAPPCFYS